MIMLVCGFGIMIMVMLVCGFGIMIMVMFMGLWLCHGFGNYKLYIG